ncbi:hypothetical protein [Lacrimispora indolis]|uniref:hypothetical protein n=1 Tax=Lacrimispora indolis TaxID=69825 RepID=UPI00040935F5|nr:hypothetical protein [[Clostridium] methoxybenzovorans]
MNKDLDIWKAYKPIIMMDQNEPFSITAMGCTIFRETKKSSSFPKREIDINKEEIDYAIEYAIWYDYDIQHLYELEHVWVYISHGGTVKKVEASFHGRYLNMVDLESGDPVLCGDTHPVVYAQPGKHGMVPDPRMIRVIPGWLESCLEKAGSDGVLVPDMFKDQIHVDESLQKMTEIYIKETFGFRPAIEFEPFSLPDDRLMTWEELRRSIPERVNRQLAVIKGHFNRMK